MRHTHCLRFAALAAMLGSTSAQDPAAAQQPAARTGVIVDAGGEGAAATVHACCVQGDGLGAAVAVAAAADGSFTLPASLGDHVLMFAVTANAATPLVERRGPGPIGRLHLEPSPPRQLTLDGVDAWRTEGPLRAFVLLPTAHSWPWQLDLDGRSTAKLPPLPAGELALELRTSTDEVLWRERLLRQPAVIRVAVPAPIEVHLRFEDASGAAVANVQVHHEQEDRFDLRAAPLAVRPDGRCRRLGESSAKGALTVRLPRASGRGFTGTLRGDHGTHATAHAGWTDDGASGDGTLDDGVLVITLPDATHFHVTLRRGTEPAAGRAVQLFARRSSMQHEGGTLACTVQPWRGAATTDADGRATFPSLPADASELRLVQDAGAQGPPLCVPMTRLDGQEVDVATAVRAAVRVIDANKAPVPGMRVIAMPSPRDLQFLDAHGCEPLTATDAAGRAEFMLAPGRWWVFACDDAGFAHGLIEAADPLDVEWTRTPWQVWRVEAIAAGKPAAGAHIDVIDLHWIEGTPIPDPDVLLPMQWLGHQNVLAPAAGAADAAGQLTVRWLPSVGSAVRARLVAPSGARSEPFDLDTATLPARIELR